VPSITTSAIVLHVMPYGETSKILRLLTRDLGLQSAIARGARRAKARTGPRLDLFSEGQATLAVRTQRDLHPLTAFELTAAHGGLAADIGRFAAASAVAELALRCAPEDVHPEVFDAVAAAFAALEGAAAADGDAVALAAVWGLVAALGFTPTLDRCAACGAEVHGGLAFSAAQGGALCAVHRRGVRAAQLGPGDAAALAALVAGRLPDAPLGSRHAAAHRRLLIGFIRHHLAEQREMPALAFWDADAWTATSS
jgi:DNA repair protein RecO (recombination protein O)